jgi:hypothetical protein
MANLSEADARRAIKFRRRPAPDDAFMTQKNLYDWHKTTALDDPYHQLSDSHGNGRYVINLGLRLDELSSHVSAISHDRGNQARKRMICLETGSQPEAPLLQSASVDYILFLYVVD